MPSPGCGKTSPRPLEQSRAYKAGAGRAELTRGTTVDILGLGLPRRDSWAVGLPRRGPYLESQSQWLRECRCTSWWTQSGEKGRTMCPAHLCFQQHLSVFLNSPEAGRAWVTRRPRHHTWISPLTAQSKGFIGFPCCYHPPSPTVVLFLASLCSLWDLSSPDEGLNPRAPALKALSPNPTGLPGPSTHTRIHNCPCYLDSNLVTAW